MPIDPNYVTFPVQWIAYGGAAAACVSLGVTDLAIRQARINERRFLTEGRARIEELLGSFQDDAVAAYSESKQYALLLPEEVANLRSRILEQIQPTIAAEVQSSLETITLTPETTLADLSETYRAMNS